MMKAIHGGWLCHKLILQGKMETGNCLQAIFAKISDEKLHACEGLATESEILACLK